jgi:hypothetical protein
MSMPTRELDRLERWMQAVIMHPDGVVAGVASEEARQHIDVTPGAVEQVVTRSRAQTSLERLEVYAGAYYARLLECLRDEFHIFARAVGEEVFDTFAFEYLQKYRDFSRISTVSRAVIQATLRPGGSDLTPPLAVVCPG